MFVSGIIVITLLVTGLVTGFIGMVSDSEDAFGVAAVNLAFAGSVAIIRTIVSIATGAY